MNQKVFKLSDLYCLSYGLLIFGLICGQTLLPIPSYIRYAIMFVGYCLLTIKILIDVTTNKIVGAPSIYTYVCFALMLIVACISVKSNQEYEILSTILFVFGAKDVDFYKILKTFIVVATCVLLTMVIAYFCGIIGNGTIQRTTNLGASRVTFGYRTATDLMQLVTYILLADIAIWFKKGKTIWWRVFLYLLLSYIDIKFTDSRLTSYTILALVPLILVLRYVKISDQNRILNFLLGYMFEICLLLSVVVEMLFMSHKYSVLTNFDVFSSARLTNVEMGLKLFGYTLFGQDIYTRILRYWTGWFYIDSSYYTFLIEYGITLLIFAATTYTITVKRFIKKSYAIAIIMAVICIDSMICREYFLIEYNPFILALFANIENIPRPYNLMCKDEQFLKVNQNWV